MILFLFLLSEFERLNNMFGEGQWVMCIGCSGGPTAWSYHHRKYHEKRY